MTQKVEMETTKRQEFVEMINKVKNQISQL